MNPILLHLRPVIFAVSLLGALLPGRADSRPIGATSVFARIPAPGMPEGIAVRDGKVYVSTHTSVFGNAEPGPSQIVAAGNQGASKIFAFDLLTGARAGELAIEGQNLGVTHGILAMAFDASGRLYAIDQNPGRLLRIDISSGLSNGIQETNHTFFSADPNHWAVLRAYVDDTALPLREP